ncbi:MAG TPA: SLBB domain-containing protein, partial [Nevskiaceae bacterium]|nr:SLBB domain-containing protein [Nevskiaceae bacterium]
VYVGGEVKKPGAIPLVGPTTVSRAIFLAEGFATSARESQVLLIRPGPDGQPTVQEVNMERLLDGEAGTKDVLLGPQDIVFVPRSPIANANLWVQQYIKDLVPFGLNAGVSYSINDDDDNND